MTYKGIYHAHSTYSGDGTRSLAELKVLLLRKGIQFAVMTEHAEDMTPHSLAAYIAECRALSDVGFLFIPGLEIPYVGRVHVGCFPVTPTPEVPMFEAGIASLHDRKVFTILHHPSKENYYYDDRLPALLDGVEVWNSRYEGIVAPSAKTMAFVQEKFPRMLRFGGLDFHAENQLAGPRIIVDVETLSEENVVRCFRRGEVVVAGRFFRFAPSTLDSWMVRLIYTFLRTGYVLVRKLIKN